MFDAHAGVLLRRNGEVTISVLKPNARRLMRGANTGVAF